MADDAAEDEGHSTLGMAAAICGGVALAGHGLCCVPIISSVAPMIVVMLEALSIGLALVARSQAAKEGRTDSLANVGLGLGVAAMLMTGLLTVVFGGLVMSYLALVIGVVIAGNA